jgi:hypothetical protein
VSMAKITASEANAIKRRHSRTLLSLPGVQGVGLHEDGAGNQSLVVLVDAEADLSKLPAEIEGLPVTTEATGPFRPLQTVQ